MITIELYDKEYTSITEIAKYLCKGNDQILSEVRKNVSSRVNQDKKIKEKVLRIDESDKEMIIDLLPENYRFNSKPFLLVPTEYIEDIERKIIFIVKRLMEGTYKKDRYYAKRKSLYDELVYVLNQNKIYPKGNLFKAVLSAMKRIEDLEVNKSLAIKQASEKFNEKQTDIKELLELVQINMTAQQNARKSYGASQRHQYIAKEKTEKRIERED